MMNRQSNENRHHTDLWYKNIIQYMKRNNLNGDTILANLSLNSAATSSSRNAEVNNQPRTAQYDFESSRQAIEKKTHNGFKCDISAANLITRFCKKKKISQARYKFNDNCMRVYIGNTPENANNIFEFKFDDLAKHDYRIYSYDFNNRKLIKVIEPYFNFVLKNFSGTRVLYSRSKKTDSHGVTDSNYKKLRESTLSSIKISVFI